MTAPQFLQIPDDRVSLLVVLAKAIQADTSMDERTARAMAARLVGQIRQQLCGEKLYIAKQNPEENIERDTAIRRDYDGSRASRERLQLRWDVSRATFYRIISGVGLVPIEFIALVLQRIDFALRSADFYAVLIRYSLHFVGNALFPSRASEVVHRQVLLLPQLLLLRGQLVVERADRALLSVYLIFENSPSGCNIRTICEGVLLHGPGPRCVRLGLGMMLSLLEAGRPRRGADVDWLGTYRAGSRGEHCCASFLALVDLSEDVHREGYSN